MELILKRVNFVVALILAMVFCGQAGAATVWSDNFNYPAGQTLASNGWVLTYGDPGASAYDPATDMYWESRLDSTTDIANSGQSLWQVKGASFGNVGMTAKHAFAATSKGGISFYVKTNQNSDSINPARVFIKSPTGTVAFVNFAAQWGVYLNGRKGIGAFAKNVWYRVEMTWDDATKQAALKVEGIGDTTDSYLDTAAATADAVEMYHSCAAGTTTVAAWYDNVTVTNDQPTATVGAWSDNFDYPVGQTMAQNGWMLEYGAGASGYNPAVDQYWEIKLDGAQFVSGPQCAWLVQGSAFSNVYMRATHSFTPLQKGQVSFDVKSSHNSDSINPARLFIYSADDKVIGWINFAAQWGVYLNSSKGIGAYNANQWYHVTLTWDAVAKQISMKVDGIGSTFDSFSDITAGSAAKIQLLHNTNASLTGPSWARYDNIVVQRICTSLNAGDFNKDCVIDFKDIAVLVGSWLDCTDQTNANCVWP